MLTGKAILDLRDAARELAHDCVVRNASDPDAWADFLETLLAPWPWGNDALYAVEEASQELLSQKAVRIAADEVDLTRLMFALAEVMDRDPADLNSELAAVAECRWLKIVKGAA